jgi:hypothetical protein
VQSEVQLLFDCLAARLRDRHRSLDRPRLFEQLILARADLIVTILGTGGTTAIGRSISHLNSPKASFKPISRALVTAIEIKWLLASKLRAYRYCDGLPPVLEGKVPRKYSFLFCRTILIGSPAISFLAFARAIAWSTS